MAVSSLFRSFLGLHRFNKLFNALKLYVSEPVQVEFGHLAFLLVILVALLPVFAAFGGGFGADFDFTILVIGIATLFAIVFRSRAGIGRTQRYDWRQALSLTHTAFALGCIPAIVVISFFPAALSETQSLLIEETSGGRDGGSVFGFVFFVFAASFWAALTEEFIFRGLFISIARRYSGIKSQKARDVVAIGFSAGLFGLGHVFTWGPIMGCVIAGLGIGFGVAYLAIGEKVYPLILYHTLFDMLSLFVAAYMGGF